MSGVNLYCKACFRTFQIRLDHPWPHNFPILGAYTLTPQEGNGHLNERPCLTMGKLSIYVTTITLPSGTVLNKPLPNKWIDWDPPNDGNYCNSESTLCILNIAHHHSCELYLGWFEGIICGKVNT